VPCIAIGFPRDGKIIERLYDVDDSMYASERLERIQAVTQETQCAEIAPRWVKARGKCPSAVSRARVHGNLLNERDSGVAPLEFGSIGREMSRFVTPKPQRSPTGASAPDRLWETSAAEGTRGPKPAAPARSRRGREGCDDRGTAERLQISLSATQFTLTDRAKRRELGPRSCAQ